MTASFCQALEAGLWLQLEAEDQKSARAVCKDWHSAADKVLEYAVLRVTTKRGLLSAAAEVAAYHRKLPLKTLEVKFSSEDDTWDACPTLGPADLQQFFSLYASAIGPSSLTATTLTLELPNSSYPDAGIPDGNTLLHLLRAVKHAEHVTIACNCMERVQTPLLAALGECLKVKSLTVRCDLEKQQDIQRLRPDVLHALCSLTSLRSLRGPWHLTKVQLQQLGSSLPLLECLGFGELTRVRDDEAVHFMFPRVHTLTGPPTDDQKNPSRSSWWFHAGIKCHLPVSALISFPALRHLQDVTLRMVPSARPQALAAAAALMASQPAASASWGISARLTKDTPIALPAAIAPACWQHLRYVQLVLVADPVDLPAWVETSLQGVCQSAVNLHTLDVTFDIPDRSRSWLCCDLVATLAPMIDSLHYLTSLCVAPSANSRNDPNIWNQYTLMQLVLGLALSFKQPLHAASDSRAWRAGRPRLWLRHANPYLDEWTDEWCAILEASGSSMELHIL